MGKSKGHRAATVPTSVTRDWSRSYITMDEPRCGGNMESTGERKTREKEEVELRGSSLKAREESAAKVLL